MVKLLCYNIIVNKSRKDLRKGLIIMFKYNQGNDLIDLASLAEFGPATEAKVVKIDNQTNTDYLYVNERAVQKRMAEDQED